jgi:dipeptide/tripeptide permease
MELVCPPTTQFSLWSVMAAPLLIGSSILNLTQWDLETYTNIEVISVDQDPLGYGGLSARLSMIVGQLYHNHDGGCVESPASKVGLCTRTVL